MTMTGTEMSRQLASYAENRNRRCLEDWSVLSHFLFCSAKLEHQVLSCAEWSLNRWSGENRERNSPGFVRSLWR